MSGTTVTSDGSGSSPSGTDVGRDRSVSVPNVEARRRRTSSTSGVGGRTILLCVDPSDNAKWAFNWYLEEVHRVDDLIILIHCPEPPKLPTFSFKSGIQPPIHEWKDILDDMNARTRKLEEDYEGTCIQKKLKYKVRGETMKNPGEGILKVAEEELAQMIIMGTRGQGKVKRALLGSVSDYVVRNAMCPVITVPGRKMRQRAMSGVSENLPMYVPDPQ